MIMILGANGSMGRRYQAILKYIDRPVLACDLETKGDDLLAKAAACDGIIVCTPTDTHYKILKQLAPLNKYVLCEKPITKNLNELSELMNLYANGRLKMVMQYAELDTGAGGRSYYNYYNHGRDGLAWDCMQIIGLARGEWTVDETSPIWKCELNGKNLNLADMDTAYITMMRKWFLEPKEQMLKIYDIHAKVSEAIRGKNGH